MEGGLSTCDKCRSSGDSPPCIQKILSSTTAATGMQLKRSEKVRQSLTEYLEGGRGGEREGGTVGENFPSSFRLSI